MKNTGMLRRLDSLNRIVFQGFTFMQELYGRIEREYRRLSSTDSCC
ncbi:UNVERIFIED_CONTAM: hypothetical protein ABIC26_004051 [Paenibacillus sp. PvR008]